MAHMKGLSKTRGRLLLRIIIPAYPTFNIYSFVADKTTSLGPIYIASSAKEVEGWEVEVIDENNLRRHGPIDSDGGADHETLQQMRPADVVGFYGGLTSTIPRIYTLARFYKQKGVLTVAGGQHFVEETIPEALSRDIDYLVLGEGEQTIKELLRILKSGGDLHSVRGLVFKENSRIVNTGLRPPVQDLDALPLPDFSLIRYAKIEIFPVGRVRGCGMNCEFCTVKGRPRYASPERLVDQITRLVETMGAREFFIVDDLFGQDRKETLRLCRMLEEYQKHIAKRLSITIQIRLDKARDEELLKAMRKAGIKTVAVGFESPIKEELQAMNKRLKPEEMLSLAKKFRKFGFFVHGMFIFGYPMRQGSRFHMTVDQRIKRFKKFIKKARIDTIQLMMPVPLPGTELRTRLSEQNRIYHLKDLGWEYYDGNFPLIEPDEPLTSDEMQLALRKIMGRFYNIRCHFMFMINLISFPQLLFYFYNVKSGWKSWYRRWRNYIIRICGRRILKAWTSQLYKGTFFEKLKNAKSHIKTKANPVDETRHPVKQPPMIHG